MIRRSTSVPTSKNLKLIKVAIAFLCEVVMVQRQRVILYGKSIILATVAASLAHYPDLEIVALSPPLPDVEALEALAPDVIIFDVGLGQPEPIFTLLRLHPNLFLIGVNPENEHVKLWSSARGEVVTAADLFQLISEPLEPEQGTFTLAANQEGPS